jgi:hypothetical protein
MLRQFFPACKYLSPNLRTRSGCQVFGGAEDRSGVLLSRDQLGRTVSALIRNCAARHLLPSV